MRGVTALALCAVGAAAAGVQASSVRENHDAEVAKFYSANEDAIKEAFPDPGDLSQAFDQFLAHPELHDGSIGTQYLQLLTEGPPEGAEAPASEGRGLRSLASINDMNSMTKRAVEHIFSAQDYPSSITVTTSNGFWFLDGQDKVKFVNEGGVCYVVAQESTGEAGDWWENFKSVTTSSIESARPARRVSYQSCSGWGWRRRCQTQYRYENYGPYGAFGDGFADAYDDMRYNLQSMMSAKCGNARSTVYAGYSRGGALAQVIAYGHVKDGLSKGDRHLVTLGSPRAVGWDYAGELEGMMSSSVRVQAGNDCVTAVPFGNVKHVGRTRVNTQGHGMDDNSGGVSSWVGSAFDFVGCSISDHAGYDDYFHQRGLQIDYDITVSGTTIRN